MDVNVPEINESSLQTVLDYLDKIAVKLNIGIHQVWPWFVKQQFVDAYVSLGLLLVSILVAAILLMVTLKLWRRDDKYSKEGYYYKNGEKVEKDKEKLYTYSIFHQNHETEWVWANLFCITVVLLAGSLFYLQFFDIFNPEYSAFKDLLLQMPLPTVPK